MRRMARVKEAMKTKTGEWFEKDNVYIVQQERIYKCKFTTGREAYFWRRRCVKERRMKVGVKYCYSS
jgi:hypothetical protein